VTVFGLVVVCLVAAAAVALGWAFAAQQWPFSESAEQAVARHRALYWELS
jgi:hypothetical protein